MTENIAAENIAAEQVALAEQIVGEQQDMADAISSEYYEVESVEETAETAE